MFINCLWDITTPNVVTHRVKEIFQIFIADIDINHFAESFLYVLHCSMMFEIIFSNDFNP